MPPVTPRTIRRPASTACVSRRRARPASAAAAASASAISSGDGPSTATILSAAISSKAIDSGLRATEVTCGGTMVPRPSPSWPKYELIWRARVAPRVTRRNFESDPARGAPRSAGSSSCRAARPWVSRSRGGTKNSTITRRNRRDRERHALPGSPISGVRASSMIVADLGDGPVEVVVDDGDGPEAAAEVPLGERLVEPLADLARRGRPARGGGAPARPRSGASTKISSASG